MACGNRRIYVHPLAYTYSHKAISPQRRGLRRDWEGAQQLLQQLVAFAKVINVFLLPPVLFIEYTLNLLYLERGLLSIWAGAHRLFNNYGSGNSCYDQQASYSHNSAGHLFQRLQVVQVQYTSPLVASTVVAAATTTVVVEPAVTTTKLCVKLRYFFKKLFIVKKLLKNPYRPIGWIEKNVFLNFLWYAYFM